MRTSAAASFLRRHAQRLVAVTLVAGLYWFARLPVTPAAERTELAARFHFVKRPLPEMRDLPHASVRHVHPSLQRISAWISSVGASVALNDLDGDGLPNDVCHVDTRTDSVIVSPAPGTPPRYVPFTLDPAPLPYDAGTMAPMGCLPGDLNEDGRVDLLVYYWRRTPIAFLRSSSSSLHIGDARADSLTRVDYVPVEVKQPIERWYTNAATLADVDGDGHVDLIVGNYFQDGSRILDATASGRESMQDSMSRARNAGRHRVLLFSSAAAGAHPAVRFVEAASALDEADAFGWTLAVGAADLDGDLLPELYFANDFGPDQLLHNRSRPGAPRFVLLHGRKRLTTPNSKVLGRDSFKGMGVDFGDLNGDGWPDIYVSNIAAEYALEESHFAFVSTGDIGQMRDAVAPYVDESERLGLSRSGWAWDAKLADFDNDGVLEAIQATGFVSGRINRWPELQELAMGNDQLLSDPRSWLRVQPGDDLSGHQPNPFFVRDRTGRYTDIARELGLDDPQVTRGIAIADVDGDGLLDFAVANQWEPSYLYANEANRTSGGPANAGANGTASVNASARTAANAFLGLHLLLPVAGRARETTMVHSGHPGADVPGRAAIGAAVTVHRPDGRRLVAQVDGGNGHSGKRSADVHVGLGALKPDAWVRVDLRWRSAEGRVLGETLRLVPGWHTVLLASPAVTPPPSPRTVTDE